MEGSEAGSGMPQHNREVIWKYTGIGKALGAFEEAVPQGQLANLSLEVELSSLEPSRKVAQDVLATSGLAGHRDTSERASLAELRLILAMCHLLPAPLHRIDMVIGTVAYPKDIGEPTSTQQLGLKELGCESTTVRVINYLRGLVLVVAAGR